MAMPSLAEQRVRDVVSDGRRTLVDLGDRGVVAVPCAPDAARGRAVLSGARRPSWVLLEIDGDQVTGAVFATAGRVPHLHRVSPGAALHLAAAGVPAFVRGDGR